MQWLSIAIDRSSSKALNRSPVVHVSWVESSTRNLIGAQHWRYLFLNNSTNCNFTAPTPSACHPKILLFPQAPTPGQPREFDGSFTPHYQHWHYSSPHRAPLQFPLTQQILLLNLPSRLVCPVSLQGVHLFFCLLSPRGILCAEISRSNITQFYSDILYSRRLGTVEHLARSLLPVKLKPRLDS